MALISVIIPVYNVEKYLKECLDSVLAQTFTDFELILFDDGSTDSSPAICDAYAARDNRVCVFHQENQGQAAARNFGVTQAAAEWIAFVDADDVVHPQYLEMLYRSVLEQNTRLSMCGAVEGDRVPDGFRQIAADSTCEVFLADDPAMFDLRENHLLKYCDVWAKLVHRTVIEKYPFADGRIFEDAAVVCRWIVSANTVSNLAWGGTFTEKIRKVR